MAYPYYRDFPADFDVRNCEWYQTCVKSAQRSGILWQPPSCSKVTNRARVIGTLALRDDANNLLGAAAARDRCGRDVRTR